MFDEFRSRYLPATKGPASKFLVVEKLDIDHCTSKYANVSMRSHRALKPPCGLRKVFEGPKSLYLLSVSLKSRSLLSTVQETLLNL
jgi:hypothetical protein